ncbi:MAG: ABC transporter substrate-binding protein [Oligoflexia bacterium]|nr:ABC transporter substrate-binding protein [Oligoflexia bacterium]MBF0367154.1 ABC transporter substrate-binding protein [Oligoflexia bacterium]
MKFIPFSLFLLMIFSLLSFSCTKKSADTIVIGNYGSLTGSEATFGLSTRDGIQLAIDEFNSAGGLNGKKLELKVYDNQGKPEEARLSVEKLINVDKVVALLGEVASTRSLAAAPVAQQYKVPMITPSSTNPEVTKKGNFIFRTCFIDPFQGQVMAKFAVNSLKLKRGAILRDNKSDYSMGLADYFTKTLTELGGTVIADEKYASGDSDFKAQLTSLREKHPDFIFIPGYYTEVGLIARQARELGISSMLLGGDGWDSPKLIEIGGTALDGSYFSNHYTAEDKRPEVQEFITKFKNKYNVAPDGLAAAGYDAAQILLAAMKRAKSLEGDDLRLAIAATTNHPGVTGMITINSERDAVKSAVVLRVSTAGSATGGGEFKFVESVHP